MSHIELTCKHQGSGKVEKKSSIRKKNKTKRGGEDLLLKTCSPNYSLHNANPSLPMWRHFCQLCQCVQGPNTRAWFFFLCFVTLTCKSNLCSPFQVSLVQTLPQKGWCPLSVKKDKWQCRCAWVSFTKTKHSWENTHRLKTFAHLRSCPLTRGSFFFFF